MNRKINKEQNARLLPITLRLAQYPHHYNMLITITHNVKITHLIKGYEMYGIVKGDGIYSFHTQRKLQKTVKGYTIGYWIGGKFLSMQQIKKLAIPYKEEKLPF